MLEIIASEDYRKFLEDREIKLSDWDRAALIYNCRIANHDEKVWALLDLRNKTSDETLKKQIAERLSRDKMLYEKFKINDGNAFYILSVWCETGYKEDGYYLDFQSAFEAGQKENTPFQIDKKMFECKKSAGEDKGVFGNVGFLPQGYRSNIFWMYSDSLDDSFEDSDKPRFENRFIDIPLMFRRKDMVHILGTELYGIVDGPLNDEDELRQRNCAANRAYHDFQVNVNLIYDGQNFLSAFSQMHIPPTELEYIRLDDSDQRKGMMEYMVKTLYEKSWFGGSGRDPGRISAVLSHIETIWRQYPDMRLGQLLINISGKQDLFAIEDELLLERLQYNQFPAE